MKHFINTNKIIEAFISEPYENSGESWDMGNNHGWEVILITGYSPDGYPNKITIPHENETDCFNKIKSLGLIQII